MSPRIKGHSHTPIPIQQAVKMLSNTLVTWNGSSIDSAGRGINQQEQSTILAKERWVYKRGTHVFSLPLVWVWATGQMCWMHSHRETTRSTGKKNQNKTQNRDREEQIVKRRNNWNGSLTFLVLEVQLLIYLMNKMHQFLDFCITLSWIFSFILMFTSLRELPVFSSCFLETNFIHFLTSLSIQFQPFPLFYLTYLCSQYTLAGKVPGTNHKNCKDIPPFLPNFNPQIRSFW